MNTSNKQRSISLQLSNTGDQYISQLKNQEYQFYQHLQGSCVCGQCTCGRCLCKLKQNEQRYPSNMSSLYQADYLGKNTTLQKPYKEQEYQQTDDLPNKQSTYNDNFQPFKIKPSIRQQRYHSSNQPTPFSCMTSYQKHYPSHKNQQNLLLKPIDQIYYPKELPQKFSSTYGEDYLPKKLNDGDFINFTKILANKRSNNGDKFYNLQSTYGNDYSKKNGKRENSLPQKGTFLITGQQKDLTGAYDTENKKEFGPKQARRCPARISLEQMSMTHFQ